MERRMLRTGGAGLAVALLAVALLAGTVAAQTGSNLRIVKADGPDPVRVGAQLTYTIGVENLGPEPATGVTVIDNLPNGVDLVSAVGPVGPCAALGRKLTCAIGSLAPIGVNYGGTQVTITVVVIPRRTGTIRNTATVDGDQPDRARGNNRARATTRVLAVATCRGFEATVVGTPGDDALLGTPGPDVIVGFGGNDRIGALSGRDLICAGRGHDRIGAGTAADRVFAGPDRDRVLGRGGPDVLRGSGGADVLKGGRGSDRLRGGRDFDRLRGGPGSDNCRGGGGRDSIRGCER